MELNHNPGGGGNPGVTDDPGTGGGGEGGACANFEGECQGNEIVDEGECQQCFCQVRILMIAHKRSQNQKLIVSISDSSVRQSKQ